MTSTEQKLYDEGTAKIIAAKGGRYTPPAPSVQLIKRYETNNANTEAVSGMTSSNAVDTPTVDTLTPPVKKSSNPGRVYKGKDGQYYNQDTGQVVFDPVLYQRDLEKAQRDLEREKEITRAGLIDAISSKYKAQKTGIQELGAAELARQRTLNLRSGTIDSPIGDTEIGKTTKKTQEAIDANEAAKAAEITQAIMGLDEVYSQRKRDVATDKLNELKTGADLRAAQIAELDERRKPVKNILTSFAQKGVTYDQFKLDPRYEDVIQDFSDDEIEEIFALNQPEAEVKSTQIKGGKLIQVTQKPGQDPVVYTKDIPGLTGNYSYLNKVGDTLVYAPEDWDGDTSKLKTYTVGSGNNDVPTLDEQKKALQNVLSTGIAPSGEKLGASRGSDGYADPNVYIAAFENWTGTVADFLRYFPVAKNVNPASYKLLPEAIRPASSRQG